MKKRILAATALLLFLGGCFLAWRHMGVQAVPGLTGKQRTLLRIWTVSSPGGGQAWLKQQLRAFEKANPGISTWVRTVAAEDLGGKGVHHIGFHLRYLPRFLTVQYSGTPSL